MSRWGRPAVPLLVAAMLLGSGCAARMAYRKGQSEARKGNWDLAVARLTKACQKDPDNIGYRLALENTRIQASRYHQQEAVKHLAQDELAAAADELDIAVKYDPSNMAATDELAAVRKRILEREQEKQRLSDFDRLKKRSQAARVPLPVLSPRSPVPISLNFPDESLEKIFDALSKLSGVNILLDDGFRDKDKRVTLRLSGVTFEQALDQITTAHRLFYKVLDQNTLIVVPENPAKRRAYDDQLVQTFYLDNADPTEMLNLVKTLTGIKKSQVNKTLKAITLLGTPDELAMAARIIEAHDKALGEVLVEVEILEVNRSKLKEYGIELSNYQAKVTFAPTGYGGGSSAGAEGTSGGTAELSGGFTQVRAHLLSSLNLSDFVLAIPSTLLTKFLQTDGTVRILAAPRLRATEGKKTTLTIGQEIPVPMTSFPAVSAGGVNNYQQATSFQYRNVGVNLDLTPSITAGGEIVLEIAYEFSVQGEDRAVSAGEQPLTAPTFLTRAVNGTLRVRDGQTTLIGGLLQQRETDTLKGIIGLQSIPVLNKIFTSTSKKDEESEVLISLTPHLVRAPRVTERDLESMFVGTQESIRVPSARPLFGPEPEPEAEVAEPASAPAAAAPQPNSAAPQAPAPAPPPSSPQPPRGTPQVPLPPTEAAEPPPARINASVRLSPRTLALGVGQSAVLSVVVIGASDLVGVDLTLGFDEGLLELVESGPGSLLTLDGASIGAQRQVEPGRLGIRLTRPAPTEGSGAVATFRFTGRVAGEGQVRIESMTLQTSRGPELPAGLPGPAPVKVNP